MKPAVRSELDAAAEFVERRFGSVTAAELRAAVRAMLADGRPCEREGCHYRVSPGAVKRGYRYCSKTCGQRAAQEGRRTA